MTDSIPPLPTGASEQKPVDDLFEADFLADADSDFLGELDRVLTGEGDESDGSTLPADVATALEPLDLDIGGDSIEQGPAPGSAPAVQNTEHVEAATPAAAKVPDRLQDLRQHRKPEAAQRPGTVGPAASSTSGAGAALPVNRGEEATGQAAASAASVPPRLADRKSAREPEAPVVGKKTRIRVPKAAEARPSARVSPVWLGLVALLSMIGIGVGGTAIWLQMDTEAHLAWMESELAAAAGPSPAEVDAQNRRLQSLEQRLQDEIAGLGASLEQRVAHRDDLLEMDLEKLQSAMLEVHGHLEEVQSQLAALARPVAGAHERRRGPATATDSAAASKSGGWVVNLISFRTRAKADTWAARLRDEDIQASVRAADHKGKTWYRVLVDGFEDFAEAKAFAGRVRANPDLQSAWVGRNR